MRLMTNRENSRELSREANVLLELRTREAMSEEALDMSSDELLEAVGDGAAGIALGPAVALNLQASAIKLRFDVLGGTDLEIHERVAGVLAIIERDTGLVLARSSVETCSASRGLAAA